MCITKNMNDFEKLLAERQEKLRADELKRVIDRQVQYHHELESWSVDGNDPFEVLGESDAGLVTDFLDHMQSRAFPGAKALKMKREVELPLPQGRLARLLGMPHSVQEEVLYETKGYFLGYGNFKRMGSYSNGRSLPHRGAGKIEITGGRKLIEYDPTQAFSYISDTDIPIWICTDGKIRTNEAKKITQQISDVTYGGWVEITRTNSDDRGNESRHKEKYFYAIDLENLLFYKSETSVASKGH